MSTKKCEHNRLKPGSGGYYIMCSDCGAAWVAIKSERLSDADFDYDRGHEILQPREWWTVVK